MSATLLLIVSSLAVSAIALALLALRDPKRLRMVGQFGDAAWSSGQRRLLTLTTLTPGVLLMLTEQWAAFLIWFGAVGAIGWTFAQLLAPRVKRS